ncbi:MAG: ribosomal protein S18-alanine N-acetyltransferase [Spirochaetes bacterium]|nr:ribosomal protein S18-alanine N-acetyltransferase [Spirochaetota bacterium]
MTSTRVRALIESDVPDILKIEYSVFPHSTWTSNSFQTCIRSKSGYAYGIFLKRKLIGYIVLHVIIPEAHIVNFAVDMEYQSQGFGQELLSYIFKKLKKLKIKSIFLEVRVSNAKAISLYKKFNFKPIMIRNKYYKNNNEDGVVMALFFNGLLPK